MNAAPSPDAPATDRAIAFFRIIAIAEAVSWGALLIAMLFKYSLSKTELGVEIVGPIHGVMFLAYMATTIVVGIRCRWKPSLIILGLGAAIPPFTTVVFENWADRSGHLRIPETESAV